MEHRYAKTHREEADAYFKHVGYIALSNVIDGVITYPEAIESLAMLRKLITNKCNKTQIKQYCKSKGWLKGTNLAQFK